MDHAEEQALEVEALRSIFYDEFSEEAGSEGRAFGLLVRSSEGSGPDGSAASEVRLRVAYTPAYPETPPHLALDGVVGLDEAEAAALLAGLVALADGQIGMAMVFALHAAAVDALDAAVRDQRLRRERELQELQAQLDAEEARARQGTSVTPESFGRWRAGFLREVAADERRIAIERVGLKALQRAEANKGKTTGRALFEKDRSLAKSDAAMMADDDADLVVDANLFVRDDNVNIDDDDDDNNNAVLAGFRDDDD
ncbi:RWD domain-containing protein 1 [Physocladia obscura]|uniref:RWD domain-containing protein 1 n=1 Tax=Physocladia obscura TaxID=109957 RepID=A0AAD5T4Z8_9FUNG|nr:RWD domain-containing protein 1 [Physocladia obscura]